MNYRTGMKLSLLAIALTLCGWGQTPNAPEKDPVVATWQTGQMWNGRFWRKLNENEKNIFLFGFSSAVEVVTIALTPNFERYKNTSKAFWPRNLTIAEVHSSLDRFYDAAENGPIPISNAIYVIAERAGGTDEESVQKIITDLRAKASKN
jgi:hypothetical protein